MASRAYQQNYERIFAARKRARAGRCACPSGARRISTKGHGRGFVCQSKKPKVVRKRGRTWLIKKPFVRAIGC